MKSNTSKKYHTRVVTNILFSTVITCLVEVFLVANLSMLADYALNEGSENLLLAMIAGSDVAVVLAYFRRNPSATSAGSQTPWRIFPGGI